MDDTIYDVIILGGGPGGYTAALYCARAGLRTLVLEKLSAGGQMAQAHEVDNYPGFDEGIDGFTLAEKMQRGAERFGAETQPAEVHRVTLNAPVKLLETSEGVRRARCVLIATGAGPKPLGLPDEEALAGRGVSYCAACDGMRCRGKRAVVAGGGNTAVSDALLLSRLCERVTVVHRRDSLRAEKICQRPLLEAGNVDFRWNSAVTALLHEDRLTGVEIESLATGEREVLPCAGVFVCIGRKPETSLFLGQLDMDAQGYLIADESTRTKLPGVFAVGDVRTKALRQIITAAADGAIAAHYAGEYLAEEQSPYL